MKKFDQKDYDDIRQLPHPDPRNHPRMSMRDRAAQFSPFAALTGYDAAVEESERLTQEWKAPDEAAAEELDRKLGILQNALANGLQPEIKVTYFREDDRKEGGSYQTKQGEVRRIDACHRQVIFQDGECVPLIRICEMEQVGSQDTECK